MGEVEEAEAGFQGEDEEREGRVGNFEAKNCRLRSHHDSLVGGAMVGWRRTRLVEVRGGSYNLTQDTHDCR